MDILIAILTITSGFLTGMIVLDWRARREAGLRLDAAAAEMAKVVREIQAAHNSLATEIASMSDRVASHEMRLSGRPVGASRTGFQNASVSP